MQHTIRLYNRGKQMIPLHVRRPGSDFFLNEQQVALQPGKTVELIKDHTNAEQIQNLRARGMIQVVYDSEIAAMTNQI